MRCMGFRDIILHIDVLAPQAEVVQVKTLFNNLCDRVEVSRDSDLLIMCLGLWVLSRKGRVAMNFASLC